MRRMLSTLAVLAAGGLALAGCASGDDAPPSVEQPAPAESATPGETPEGDPGDSETPETDGSTAAERGADACASLGRSGGDGVCVLEGETLEGDHAFEDLRVVKIIDTTVEGDLTIDASTQVVVTDGSVDGDLDIASDRRAVLKLTSVDGDVRIDAGAQAVVAESTIDGDLSCAVPHANGGGNTVGGSAADACAPLG